MIRKKNRKPNIAALILGLAFYIQSTDKPKASTPQYSPANSGFLGLNTIPNARMDDAGTLRIGTSTLDPYLNGYIGLQVTSALSVVLRQSAETSDLTDSPERLYPGLDFKLRLYEEQQRRPALVIGAQSAFGHKRMSGEYIALSKRYHNFDFTAGLGWGRFGTAGHIDNPLHIFGNHFKKNRNFDSETANTPEYWFTGDKVGFFGGIQYFTPIKGLSLKLDYGADRYTAEQQDSTFDTGAPWTIGADYTYKKWLTAGIGIQGNDKIMARLSLQSNPKQWPLGEQKKPNQEYSIRQTPENDTSLHADLKLHAYEPASRAIGRTLKDINKNAKPKIEEIKLTPHYEGLNGQTLSMLRKDVENALRHEGSPQEIWDNTKIHPNPDHNNALKPHADFRLIFDNQISLAEDEIGVQYRSSLIPQLKIHAFKGLSLAGGIRLNIGDNLFDYNTARNTPTKPVRSNINDFTQTLISIDDAYLNYTSALTPGLYGSITAGYLEELYAGYGAKILYRPYKSRLAAGIEAWHAKQRDPTSRLNLKLKGRETASAFFNIWYDLPEHDMTASLKTGRFLGGDAGTRLQIQKRLDNGIKIEGQITASNRRNSDAFGGTTNLYHGLTLTVPFGDIPKVPKNSVIRVSAKPFGRDIGQTLNTNENIYEKTQKLSYGETIKNWKDLFKK